jgi:phosphoglycolate phosphatase-like HAD superfamily hydrolase
MKLVLFDIDGTLLTTDGAGRAALRAAAADVFGVHEDLQCISISGRTDVSIIRDILAAHDLPADDRNVNRYIGGYLTRLHDKLKRYPGGVLPGIRPLLDALAELSCRVGLLTGNLQRGAQIKLDYHGLWGRFPCGAFADDSPDRNDLGPIARKRAAGLFNEEFPAHETYIIGDTPRDIACARASGARAVAVATGRFTLEQLAADKPDYLFPNLTDTDKVLAELALR